LLKNKKLKILMLSVWYPSKVSPGKGTFVKEFARALSLFSEVTVVSPVPVSGEFQGKELPFINDSAEDGIRTILAYYKKPVFFNLLKGLYYFTKALKQLLKSSYKPDVVNAHVYYSALPMLLIPELRKVPLAVSEHSSAFISKNGIGFIRGILAGIIFRRAKVILPVSLYLKDAILEFSGKIPVEIVPNTYDRLLFNTSARKDAEDGKTHLLFVGSLVPVKGVDILLKSFSLLKDRSLILDIVGDGRKRSEYEKLAVVQGVAERVKFHGFLTKSEVAELMSKSNIFVLCSRTETFGCVLMEAAGAGLPVVTVRVGGVPEVVNESMGVLVKPDSPEAFAEGIEKMLSMLDKFEPETIAAEASVRFSHEKVGEKLADILRKQLY